MIEYEEIEAGAIDMVLTSILVGGPFAKKEVTNDDPLPEYIVLSEDVVYATNDRWDPYRNDDLKEAVGKLSRFAGISKRMKRRHVYLLSQEDNFKYVYLGWFW